MTIAVTPVTVGTESILDLFRAPQPETLVVSAHRGLYGGDVPENSRKSLIVAAAFGLLCIEVDLRLTSDGHPIVQHDATLGRVTNIAEHLGKEEMGIGLDPEVCSLPWSGVLEHLRLRDPQGRQTSERLLDLSGLLNIIVEENLDMVVFLDIKEARVIKPAYEVVKTLSNSRGVPAHEWCVWKVGTDIYPSPEALESTPWFRDALEVGKPKYIPVFEPSPVSLDEDDEITRLDAFLQRPYVVTAEIGLRLPGGALQSAVDHLREKRTGMGFFAASKSSPSATPEVESDKADQRGDIATWHKLGYTWVIADLCKETATLFANQASFKSPPSPQRRAELLSQV